MMEHQKHIRAREIKSLLRVEAFFHVRLIKQSHSSRLPQSRVRVNRREIDASVFLFAQKKERAMIIFHHQSPFAIYV
jgi:outer membrane lipopolysaccharide assembly protein LptE/RlpB